jgi:hypothetical protein
LSNQTELDCSGSGNDQPQQNSPSQPEPPAVNSARNQPLPGIQAINGPVSVSNGFTPSSSNSGNSADHVSNFFSPGTQAKVQYKSAEMFLDSSITVSQGYSKTMYPKQHALMFQDRNAETIHARNVPWLRVSHALWSQRRRAGRNAKLFICAKFVEIIQDKLLVFINELAKN